MTVRTLPPYSPQLNPVENIWDDMREKFFANIVFESMDAVENKISEACLHYEENTETVQSITAFPWSRRATIHDVDGSGFRHELAGA